MKVPGFDATIPPFFDKGGKGDSENVQIRY